jgi:NADPH2:quinone reductase
MKTVRFHQTGGPEVLVVEDVPTPEPKAHEVLIRVEAVGMNFADVLRRRGDPYPEPTPVPFTPGAEVAGTVVGIGDGVTEITMGSLVYADCWDGGYAQFICVPAFSVIPIPPGIDALQATTLVVQGLTAALSLKNAGRLAKGESVLVEASAGGVGSFAVQLAKLYGAGLVIGAASTREKRDLSLRLGADSVVDYSQPNWAETVKEMTSGRGVDIVLEMVGGATLPRALDALAPFGRMVVYGLASGEVSLVNPQRLITTNQSIIGFYIGAYLERRDLILSTLAEIVDHVVGGRLSIQIGKVLPLSQAVEAHRLLESRQTTGKIILQPWPLD